VTSAAGAEAKQTEGQRTRIQEERGATENDDEAEARRARAMEEADVHMTRRFRGERWSEGKRLEGKKRLTVSTS
jgi:hypothetical protein